jgi:ABC-type sugar transport system ATPase subunit
VSPAPPEAVRPDRIALLHRGRLQQADTPPALYGRPTNTFVASFIGTPAMNLLEGEIAGGTSQFRTGEAFSVPLGQGWNAALAGRPAAGITLGIRPEDIQRADLGRGPAGVLRSRVELAELLGGEALVHLDAGGVDLTARLPAPVPPAGSVPGLLIPGDRVHLFDRETGARIEPATPR